MDGIVPELCWSAKERLLKRLRKCQDMRLRMRYLIVINLVQHRSARETASELLVLKQATGLANWQRLGARTPSASDVVGGAG
jgi:hypothetical protein